MQGARPWLLTSIIAASLAWSTPAAADAIPNEPDDCPRGSEGVSSHCGAECAPLPCKTDGDCRDEKVCRPTRLCIEKGERSACGRVPEEERKKKYPYQVAHGKCPSGGKCDRGACEEAKRCVKPSLLGCDGCRVGGEGRALWPLLLGLLLLLRGRRPSS